MKLSSRRLRAAAALVASCGAVAATVAIATGSAAAAPAATSVVLVNCAGQAQVKPSSYVLACADAGAGLEKLSWASWKGVAFGSGTEYVNSCSPTCVSGKTYTFPVLVTLWGAKARSGHAGQQYFSELTLIHTGPLTRPHLKEPLTETFGLLPNI